MEGFGNVLLIVLSGCVTVYASRCCLPKQWEGLVGMSSGMMVEGNGIALTALFKTAYDFDRQKIYAKGSGTYDGQYFEEELLYDYGKKVMYVVVGGKCTTSPLPGKIFSCIPDTANLTLSSFYGFGDNTVPFDMYTFNTMGVPITVNVAKDSCVLLGEHYEATGTIVDIGYMGTTAGITNPAVFNVPATCTKREISYHVKEMDMTYVEHRHWSPLTGQPQTMKR